MIDIKSIWEQQKISTEVIVRTRVDDIQHLDCYIATNHIIGLRLYIMSISKKITVPDLRNLRFKGVKIIIVELDDSHEFMIYLLNNELKDIFTIFIENILEDISKSITEIEALQVTLNVVGKWKQLFDKIILTGLSLEQQKGLIGELLLFKQLIENNKSKSEVLAAWSGPDFNDKDYLFNNTAVEVKLTTSKYPKLQITNEGQLDILNLERLFLVLYIMEEVKDKGFSLNTLISDLRNELSKLKDDLNSFNEKLSMIGFYDEDSEQYNRQYILKSEYVYDVKSSFPKIIRGELPIGVYNTSYNIELSAVHSFLVNKDVLVENIF